MHRFRDQPIEQSLTVYTNIFIFIHWKVAQKKKSNK